MPSRVPCRCTSPTVKRSRSVRAVPALEDRDRRPGQRPQLRARRARSLPARWLRAPVAVSSRSACALAHDDDRRRRSAVARHRAQLARILTTTLLRLSRTIDASVLGRCRRTMQRAFETMLAAALSGYGNTRVRELPADGRRRASPSARRAGTRRRTPYAGTPASTTCSKRKSTRTPDAVAVVFRGRAAHLPRAGRAGESARPATSADAASVRTCWSASAWSARSI